MQLKTDEELLAELGQAAAGLLVMSESDYPLVPFLWNAETVITPEYLRKISDAAPDSPIEETDLATLFQKSENFRRLVRTINQNLSGVRVFKVGLINIPVYIVGRGPGGGWLGVSTRIVQT